MVFVHSRNETLRVARLMQTLSQQANLDLFPKSADYPYLQSLSKLKNKNFMDLLQHGIAIHHAGLLRPDRSKIESYFLNGHCNLLICTATLAWGVNLPSSMVIIHGTSIYNPSISGFSDLDVLDVQQIFGRAGRPQFESQGTGMLVTSSDKIQHYIEQLSLSMPIESQFTKHLPDYLLAEIVLGNVTNLEDASNWLGFTYYHTRCLKNPFVYGMTYNELLDDPYLINHRHELVNNALTKLVSRELITIINSFYCATAFGAISSHFYISLDSMQTFHQGHLSSKMALHDVINCVCMSTEFQSIKSRDDELPTLDLLASRVPLLFNGTTVDSHGKSNILLQAHLNKFSIHNSFSLQSDQYYIIDNSRRISKALFELCIVHKYMQSTISCMALCLLLSNSDDTKHKNHKNNKIDKVAHYPDLLITYDSTTTNPHSTVYSVHVTPNHLLKYNKFHLFIHLNNRIEYHVTFYLEDYSELVIHCPINTPNLVSTEPYKLLIMSDLIEYAMEMDLARVQTPADPISKYTAICNVTPFPGNGLFLDPINTQFYHDIHYGSSNILISSHVPIIVDLGKINGTSIEISNKYEANRYLDNIKPCDILILRNIHTFFQYFDILCYISASARIIATSIPLHYPITQYNIIHHNIRPDINLNNRIVEFLGFINPVKRNRQEMQNKFIKYKLDGKCNIVYVSDYRDLRNTLQGIIINVALEMRELGNEKLDGLTREALSYGIGIIHDKQPQSVRSWILGIREELKVIVQMVETVEEIPNPLFDVVICKELKKQDLIKRSYDGIKVIVMCFEEDKREIELEIEEMYLESQMEVDRDLERFKKLGKTKEEATLYLNQSYWGHRRKENPGFYKELKKIKEIVNSCFN